MNPAYKEWLEWRKNGIGGSDAPIVMGKSDKSTPFKLWEIKTGRADEPEENWAMAQGKKAEPKARRLFEAIAGKEFKATTVQHEKLSFVRASLDGLSGRVGLEIKWSGKDDFAMTEAGKIPEKHVHQLAHQCLAGDLEKVEYFSFNGERGANVTYLRNEKIEKELLKEETIFWELVKSDTAPELSDRDYRIVSDKEVIEACELFKNNWLLIKNLEVEQKQIKEMLIKRSAGNPLICAGVAVKHEKRKGSVDYDSIPQLSGVNLDQFRGKPSIVPKVFLKGEK